MAFLADPNFSIKLEYEGITFSVRPLSCNRQIEAATLADELKAANGNMKSPDDMRRCNEVLNKIVRLFIPAATDDALNDQLDFRRKYALLDKLEAVTSLSPEDKENFPSRQGSEAESFAANVSVTAGV